MARGDHDAGGRAQPPDGERQQRRGLPGGQPPDRDAGPGQHAGRLVGELLAAVPGVAADDHAPLAGQPLVAAQQPAGQRGGGGPHDGAVHPVGPGGDGAAQPGGAELQPPAEPVGQLGSGLVGLGAIGVQQLGQLPPVPLVRVVGDPRGHPGPQLGADHLSLASAARGQLRQDPGQQRAHPGRGRLAGGQHVGVVQRLVGQARGDVGDQRDAEHLRAQVPGRDGLQRGGHADQVGAAGPQHPDLGRGLVVRARQAGVDALGQVRVGRPGDGPQPRRVQVGQVGEPAGVTIRRRRAGQRGPRGQVEVVADQHRLAGPQPGADAARGVGQHDHPAARRDRHPHPVHHCADVVPLVQVRAAQEDQHPRPGRPAPTGRPGHGPAPWPARSRRGRSGGSRRRPPPSSGPSCASAAGRQPEPSTTAASWDAMSRTAAPARGAGRRDRVGIVGQGVFPARCVPARLVPARLMP